MDDALQIYSLVKPNGDDCWSCLQPMDGKEEVVAHAGVLGFKHRVHKSCIKGWVISKGSNLCPFCKQPTQVSSLFSWQERLATEIKSATIVLKLGGVVTSGIILPAFYRAEEKPVFLMVANAVGLVATTLLINGAVTIGEKIGQEFGSSVEARVARLFARQPQGVGKGMGQVLGEVGSMVLSAYVTPIILSPLINLKDLPVNLPEHQIRQGLALGASVAALIGIPVRFATRHYLSFFGDA